MSQTSNQFLTPSLREEVLKIMSLYPKPRSAILNALHLIQDNYGWVPPGAQDELGELMNIPSADIRSLVTFYYMYHRQPVGRYVIKVCKSISCWLCGSDAVLEAFKKELKIEIGQTTQDGMFTLLIAECMAACCNAPALQINDRYYHDLQPKEVASLIERLRKGDEDYPMAVESWQPEADKEVTHGS